MASTKPTSEFSDEQRQTVLAHLKAFEAGYLDMKGFLNPFRRPGVPASDLAFACGLLKDGETRSGRQKADIPAARRLLKLLIAEGLVERQGAFRTMAAGSATKDCFVLSGFSDRLEAVQATFVSGATAPRD